jgi:hypothetical protein
MGAISSKLFTETCLISNQDIFYKCRLIISGLLFFYTLVAFLINYYFYNIIRVFIYASSFVLACFNLKNMYNVKINIFVDMCILSITVVKFIDFNNNNNLMYDNIVYNNYMLTVAIILVYS